MKLAERWVFSKWIRAEGRSELYVAHGHDSGQPALVKRYPGSDGTDLASREADRLRRLAGPGIVRVQEVDSSDGEGGLVVLESLDGELLAPTSGPPYSIERWIHLAAQLATTVRHLHAKHWIHCDLNPSSVMVACGTDETWLLDLDLALEYGSPSPTEAQGNPGYMAPEQFGRMGRGIDYRSDLYSLGATFYHALTGRPPFAGENALELMHAHMAHRPVPPSELRPDTPPAIGRLLLKLLEKEPDDRYQTASALHQDLLALQEQWALEGQLSDDFVLAASDAANRPLFSKSLYGRDAEIEALAQALSRVAAGACELWLLRGAPGVGKSVLVEGLRRRSLKSGWLVQGKFDLYQRDQPYSGWTAALESLAQQILVRGAETIEAWRIRVRDALGENTGVLVDWIPDWRFILGDFRAPLQLEPREAQARLARTTVRLLQCIARLDEPLILFLDDLQWADSGSRFLIHEVLRDAGPSGLLLVGTYRDAEVDPSHPLRSLLTELESEPVAMHALDIEPLTPDATLDMLADAFDASRGAVGPLAELVQRKTENNPFLVQQFVDHMRNLGYVWYAPSTGWAWDLESMAAADISDDAVELIAARIEHLEPHAREVLVFASFIGDQFGADMLRRLANRELDAVEFSLCALSESGLIAPCRAGFRFVHDRIREAAQSLRTDAERTQLHYDTASLLLEHTPPEKLEEFATDIVDHFNRALERVPADRVARVLRLNLWAAQRALVGGAPDAAKAYAECGHRLAARAQGLAPSTLLFELDFLRAETRVLDFEYAEASEIIDSLAERAQNPVEFARAIALRIDVYVLESRRREEWKEGEAEEAVSIGVAALRRLGAPYPSNPGPIRALWELLRAYLSLRKMTADDFLQSSHESSERQEAILRIESAFGTVFFVRPYRWICGSACRVRRFREGWAGGYLPAGLCHLASGVLLAFGWRGAAERIAGIAVELMERGFPTSRPCATAMGIQGLVYAWTRHLSTCAAEIERLTHAAVESGDLLFISSGGALSAQFRFNAGEPLPGVLRCFRAAEEYGRRAFDPGMRHAFRDSAAILECLQQDGLPNEDAAPYTAAPRPYTESVRGLFWLLMQDYPRALEALMRYQNTFAMPTRVPLHRALTCAILLSQPECPDVKLCKRILREDRRFLRSRTRLCPENTLHQRLLIDAECARLAGKRELALTTAIRSVDLARKANYPVDAALALERVAHLLLNANRTRQAADTIAQAIELYSRWGAHAKVAQLRVEHAKTLAVATTGSSG